MCTVFCRRLARCRKDGLIPCQTHLIGNSTNDKSEQSKRDDISHEKISLAQNEFSRMKIDLKLIYRHRMRKCRGIVDDRRSEHVSIGSILLPFENKLGVSSIPYGC